MTDVSKLVRVKPLEWMTPNFPGCPYARTIAGAYWVRAFEPDEVWLELDGIEIGGRFHSIDAAKAAAQADFERRILDCITARTGAAP